MFLIIEDHKGMDMNTKYLDVFLFGKLVTEICAQICAQFCAQYCHPLFMLFCDTMLLFGVRSVCFK